MYLPQGILGLAVGQFAPAQRRRLSRVAIPLLAASAGALLAASGAIFVAELISALVADPFALQSQGGAASARLWGASWRGDAAATWVVPALAIGGGALILRTAMRLVASRNHAHDQAERPAS
jgi:TRAP-type C4-dicarboxylate transport system permease small subunit